MRAESYENQDKDHAGGFEQGFIQVPRKIVVRDPGALSHFRSISRASKLLTYLHIGIF